MAGARPLEIEIDDEFQRVSWRVERAAWCVFGLLVLCAALGALGGGGPLSRARAEHAGANAAYDRFVRMQSPAAVRLSAPAALEQNRLFIGDAFLRSASVERVIPEPDESRRIDGGVEMLFHPGAASVFEVVVEVKFTGPAVVRSGFVVNGSSLDFTQVVYP